MMRATHGLTVMVLASDVRNGVRHQTHARDRGGTSRARRRCGTCRSICSRVAEGGAGRAGSARRRAGGAGREMDQVLRPRARAGHGGEAGEREGDRRGGGGQGARGRRCRGRRRQGQGRRRAARHAGEDRRAGRRRRPQSDQDQGRAAGLPGHRQVGARQRHGAGRTHHRTGRQGRGLAGGEVACHCWTKPRSTPSSSGSTRPPASRVWRCP